MVSTVTPCWVHVKRQSRFPNHTCGAWKDIRGLEMVFSLSTVLGAVVPMIGPGLDAYSVPFP